MKRTLILLGGQVQLMFLPVHVALGQVNAGLKGVDADLGRWGKLVREAKISAD